MAYAVDDAIDQVLIRLNEAENSTIGEFATGTGPAATPSITSNNEIAKLFTEGAWALVRSGVVVVRGRGALTTTAGVFRYALSALTMATAGQRMLRPLAGTWDDLPLDVCAWGLFDVHNPTILGDSNGEVARLYASDNELLLAPKPNDAVTLTVEGLVAPRDQVAGANFLDVPDVWVPALIDYAVMVLALRHADMVPRFAVVGTAARDRWAAVLGGGRLAA